LSKLQKNKKFIYTDFVFINYFVIPFNKNKFTKIITEYQNKI